MIGLKWWYYAFVPNRDEPVWWRTGLSLLRHKFGHVIAFRYDTSSDVWLLCEWSQRGLFVDTLDPDEVDAIIANVRLMGGEILEYKAPDKPAPMVSGPFARYCVPIMASLASLPGWIATPDGLFRALRKRGAKVAFSDIAPLKG